jgi:hypothetical protein
MEQAVLQMSVGQVAGECRRRLGVEQAALVVESAPPVSVRSCDNTA